MDKDEHGRPRVAELVNVPINSLLNYPSFRLPLLLYPYQQAYTTFANAAYEIGQALLRHHSAPLGLETDTLAAMHRMSSATGGFVRSFRCPTLPPDGPIVLSKKTEVTTPPHTDGNAITILFNWQGGFQIARPNASSLPSIKTSGAGEEWLYLPPRPGCALVSLDDPLVVFTNGVLKSGMQRVVRPSGEQARYHRYSLLAGLRPEGSTPMRVLEGEIIPKTKNGEDAGEVLTAQEWATKKVTAIKMRSRQAQLQKES